MELKKKVLLITIDWFRDLIICIVGVVATGVLIFVAVLSYSLYHRTRSILDSVKTISRTVQTTSSYVQDKATKPLIEVAAIIQGVRQGIDAVSTLLRSKKQEGGRDV